MACYGLRDPRYGGTKVYCGTYWYIAKPGTTDVIVSGIDEKIYKKLTQVSNDGIYRRLSNLTGKPLE